LQRTRALQMWLRSRPAQLAQVVARRRRRTAAAQTPACPLPTAWCRVPQLKLQPAAASSMRSRRLSMRTERRRSRRQLRSVRQRRQQGATLQRRLMRGAQQLRLALAAPRRARHLRVRGCCWTTSTLPSSAASCKTLRCANRVEAQRAVVCLDVPAGWISAPGHATVSTLDAPCILLSRAPDAVAEPGGLVTTPSGHAGAAAARGWEVAAGTEARRGGRCSRHQAWQGSAVRPGFAVGLPHEAVIVQTSPSS
jgi:hypothetical protein